jgi:hypothetical protein
MRTIATLDRRRWHKDDIANWTPVRGVAKDSVPALAETVKSIILLSNNDEDFPDSSLTSSSISSSSWWEPAWLLKLDLHHHPHGDGSRPDS